MVYPGWFLRWAMLRGRDRTLGRLAMVGIGVVLGFALGAQVRTAVAIRSHLHILPTQLTELAYDFRQRERARENLETQVLDLRARIAAYETALTGSQVRLAGFGQQLQRMRALIGLTAVQGPGVAVEMDDSQRPLRPGENPNEVILHNYDVVEVVNELWAAGAEAVAINGQRMIATTPIKSVATTMMVNVKRINPPLRIEAIGDPVRLAAYLERPGGYVGLLRVFTFPVRVTKAAGLTIPPYGGPLQFRYARPIEILR